MIDEMPTNISGADVPNATTVRPIVNSLIPRFFAIMDELSTNLSAPQIRTDNDSPNNRKSVSYTHLTLPTT